MVIATTKRKLLVALTLSLLLLPGCIANGSSNVPPDFHFLMDVKSAGDFENCAVHYNIRIDASGRGSYDTYNTGCAIEYDTNHIVTYKRSQVIERGKFKVSGAELEKLWNSINDNNFFNLTEDYRMAMGLSYAFVVVEANGQQHVVDNIGMEVPEIKTIVEAADGLMPEGVDLDYGKGYKP